MSSPRSFAKVREDTFGCFADSSATLARPSIPLSSPLCLTHAHLELHTSHHTLRQVTRRCCAVATTAAFQTSRLQVRAGCARVVHESHKHTRPQPVTDQPPVTSACRGDSNAERHGRGTIPQHILGGGRGEKKQIRKRTSA